MMQSLFIIFLSLVVFVFVIKNLCKIFFLYLRHKYEQLWYKLQLLIFDNKTYDIYGIVFDPYLSLRAPIYIYFPFN